LPTRYPAQRANLLALPTSSTPSKTVQHLAQRSSTSSTSGYDAAGNLLSYTDTVMGTWNFQYDTLNRLIGGSDAAPAAPAPAPVNVRQQNQSPIYPETTSLKSERPSGSDDLPGGKSGYKDSGFALSNYCWTYDAFGNRKQQVGSNAPFTNAVGAASCTAASGASFINSWASYTVDGTPNTPDNGKNQVTATSAGMFTYDPSGAGYILNDGVNQYLYDGEGRICAVAATLVPGTTIMTGYLYDAEGTRIAKGKITNWSCDPTISGFQTTTDYILGLGGEQITEMGVSANSTNSAPVWQHSNVFVGGKLLGTYDKDGLHFYFDDPLGTRRAQTDAAGVLEQTCSSLPYGDVLHCTGGDLQAPTEHHFTGKERDAESGNDYFGARYYASSMGRFMSPDWSAKQEPVPYAKLDNPQSLNLYAYVLNNPLDKTDPDGHDFWDKVLNKIQGKGWVDTPRPQLASAPKAPGPVGIVNYHGHTVTNPTVKQKLTEISIQHASSTVNVSSGDRDFVPTGGSKTSAHLDGNAADFHVQGFTDSQVDANLKSSDSPVKTGFNVIQHGPDTATEGAHVHIDTENHGGASAPTSFKHEGMSPETTGHYSVDPQ
jgi:RHS repeat-associated protein